MSGAITTSRGYEWGEAPQDLIVALQQTALPTARCDEQSVTALELVPADVQTIAASVPPPTHLSHTTPGNVTATAYATVDVATIAGSYALNEFVLIDQPQIPTSGDTTQGWVVRVSAYISSTSSLKIIARNVTNANVTIPSGTVFKLVRI